MEFPEHIHAPHRMNPVSLGDFMSLPSVVTIRQKFGLYISQQLMGFYCEI